MPDWYDELWYDEISSSTWPLVVDVLEAAESLRERWVVGPVSSEEGQLAALRVIQALDALEEVVSA